GLAADYKAILPIAEQAGLKVIVDSAQSFGATIDGTCTCSLGDVACTSFFPAKPLGCYGDGGMCFTNSAQLQEIMVSLRVHGMNMDDKYDNVRIGLNARLDTLQAAILLPKLEIFADEVEKRNRVAARYNELLATTDLVTPVVPEGYVSVWAQYSLQARDGAHRSQIQAKLQENGVPTAIYYPLPLHLQGAYKNLGYTQGDMPVAETVGGRIFSLPMHPYLSEEDQDTICGLLVG
ncbi:MAG: DegT/DnrJ/EryC1/StrS family aminotransferase, partial [Proteobacteria bacterium]|nr:DegT/DnrJ/EryC1/StrS family aminotransferase [Pseudomonadota bacterium]